MFEIIIEGYYRKCGGPSGYPAKAQDRRNFVAHQYGTWFADQKLKLGRDYYVDFRANGQVRLVIKKDRAAVLFKLTWGGNV